TTDSSREPWLDALSRSPASSGPMIRSQPQTNPALITKNPITVMTTHRSAMPLLTSSLSFLAAKQRSTETSTTLRRCRSTGKGLCAFFTDAATEFTTSCSPRHDTMSSGPRVSARASDCSARAVEHYGGENSRLLGAKEV